MAKDWLWWRSHLPPEVIKTYEALHYAATTDGVGELRHRDLLKAIGGGHHRKLGPLYNRLEREGFIKCKWRGATTVPREVKVLPIPHPDRETMVRVMDMSGRFETRNIYREAQEAVEYYASEWERWRHHKVSYTPWTGDTGHMRRLLLRHSIEDLKRYIHFALEYGDGATMKAEPIATFASNINTFVREYLQLQREMTAEVDAGEPLA
jgi:hypothetical protein